MFFSILFPSYLHEQKELNKSSELPSFLNDLQLIPLFSRIKKAKAKFELDSFFSTPSKDLETIIFRQNVMKDLEDAQFREQLRSTAEAFFDMNVRLSKIHAGLSSGDSSKNNTFNKGRKLFLTETYESLLTKLNLMLGHTMLKSEGLILLRSYIEELINSGDFKSLVNETAILREKLNKVTYSLFLKDGTIRILPDDELENFADIIINTFEKFRMGKVKDYHHRLRAEPHADHIEVAILEMVRKYYPDTFRDLDAYCLRFSDFQDPILMRFSKEIFFYLSWYDETEKASQKGLKFHYPTLHQNPDKIFVNNGFDIELAISSQQEIVVNDWFLQGEEKILVVTGPNQGGKTTFARMIGQAHYLASLGLSVPGSQGALLLYDNIFTHFPIPENLQTLQGNLQEELNRLSIIFREASNHSLLILNEVFASTTLEDAIELGKKAFTHIHRIGCFAVIVTFIDELALNTDNTVSMVGEISAQDDTTRTFRFYRQPPNGLAYALNLASKHGLTHAQINERLKR